MSHRRIYIAIAGLLLAFIGLAALWVPVYLDQFDSYGIKVSCGNGIEAKLTHTDLTDGSALAARCDTAVLVRRAWAIPTVVLGSGLVAFFLIGWVRSAPPEEDPEDDETPLTSLRRRPPHPEISSWDVLNYPG